jgi:hypothetical protein
MEDKLNTLIFMATQRAVKGKTPFPTGGYPTAIPVERQIPNGIKEIPASPDRCRITIKIPGSLAPGVKRFPINII